MLVRSAAGSRWPTASGCLWSWLVTTGAVAPTRTGRGSPVCARVWRRSMAACIYRAPRPRARCWKRGSRAASEAPVRVVIAEYLALLREGLVALLRENEIDVVAQVEDGPGLLRAIAGHKPDLAIVDVRLPPTFSDEGLLAAIEARRRQPELGVLVLSQYVETAYASELIGGNTPGIGYLLKERGGDVRSFLDALARVAAGGPVADPPVLTQL